MAYVDPLAGKRDMIRRKVIRWMYGERGLRAENENDHPEIYRVFAIMRAVIDSEVWYRSVDKIVEMIVGKAQAESA